MCKWMMGIWVAPVLEIQVYTLIFLIARVDSKYFICHYGFSDSVPRDEFRQTYLWDFCYKPLWLWPTEHFASKIALYDRSGGDGGGGWWCSLEY